MKAPGAILETILYADDLDAAESFYSEIVGLEVASRKAGRQVFFRLDGQMLLVFRPEVTGIPPEPGASLPVPPHGATGPGHVCFAVAGDAIDGWRARLEERGIAIEADFEWPQGGRSIYCRDPAGNSVEFAEPRIWGFENHE